MPTRTQATIDDLYRVPGKAEIVNGELVLKSPTGDLPNTAAFEIAISLRAHAKRTGIGRVYTDNAAFIMDRRSFSPDAAYYIGPRTRGKFLDGAPIFAVEVRSEGDYGPRAERAMAEKHRDYFAADTRVVWDVDVLKDELVRAYRASDPENPSIYRRAEVAKAEPAVPGWTMPVEEIFL